MKIKNYLINKNKIKSIELQKNVKLLHNKILSHFKLKRLKIKINKLKKINNFKI